jgi:hypothetical protein
MGMEFDSSRHEHIALALLWNSEKHSGSLTPAELISIT